MGGKLTRAPSWGGGVPETKGDFIHDGFATMRRTNTSSPAWYALLSLFYSYNVVKRLISKISHHQLWAKSGYHPPGAEYSISEFITQVLYAEVLVFGFY